MLCSNCNKEIKENWKFCNHCGQNLCPAIEEQNVDIPVENESKISEIQQPINDKEEIKPEKETVSKEITFIKKEPEKNSLKSLVIIGLISLIIIIAIVSVINNSTENYQELNNYNEPTSSSESELNNVPISEKYESENLSKADLAWHATNTYGWDCNEVIEIGESNGDYYYITCNSGLKLRVYPREGLHPRITNEYGTYEDVKVSKHMPDNQEKNDSQTQEQVQVEEEQKSNYRTEPIEPIKEAPVHTKPVINPTIINNKSIKVKNGIIANSDNSEDEIQQEEQDNVQKYDTNKEIKVPYLRYIQKKLYNNFINAIQRPYTGSSVYRVVLDNQGNLIAIQTISETPDSNFNDLTINIIKYSVPFKPIVSSYNKDTVEFIVKFSQVDNNVSLNIE